MAKTSWGMSRQIEQRYARKLQEIRRVIMSELRGATTTAEVSRRLQIIANRPEFIDFVENMATNMAMQVYRQTGVQWRRQAQEASRRRGQVIFNALQNELDNPLIGGTIRDIVRNNASLIKTIPNRLDAEMVTQLAANNAFAGMRGEQIVADILGKSDNLLEWQARRIARTETAKAQSALTQVRSLAIGADWYVWRTAMDGERVREAHRHMEGILVAWNEPPQPEQLAGVSGATRQAVQPYHAGNIYNCRCYSRPLLDIDDVSWPHRVFHNGVVRNMSRAEFGQISGMLNRLAY